MMKRICCAVLLLVAGACPGCQRSTTTTTPDGEEVTVRHKDGVVEGTVKGKHGDEVRWATGGASAALPDDFPKDVAVYPKATIVASVARAKTMNVSLKSADSAEKVQAFYKDKLKRDGWEVGTSLSLPQGMMLQGEKDDRTLTVAVSSLTGETMINLTVAPKD